MMSGSGRISGRTKCHTKSNIAKQIRDGGFRPIADDEYVGYRGRMRSIALLPLLVGITLSSCAISVSLAVENRTEYSVVVDIQNAAASLWPDQEQLFRQWPDNNIITVKTDRCTRTFDLTENYSPVNEWRYSQFEIVRRFSVYGEGFLRIKMPDKAHSSSYASAPRPKQLELTPVSENCASARDGS